MKLSRLKALFLTISVGIFLILTSSAIAADSPRIVRVGIYNNPPKIFKDDQGNVTGLFGDLLNYIAKKENWQLVFVEGTFDEGLSRLSEGQIDIMVDVAESEERLQKYDLTKEAVLGSWGIVYTKKGTKISSFKDLNHKRLALLKSSVYRGGSAGIESYARAFDLDLTYIEVDEYPQVYKMIEDGTVDAAVVSRVSGLTAQLTYPNIVPTNLIFSPTELKFALTKGDVDNAYLIDRLDFWMAKLEGGYENVYQNILTKHRLNDFVSQVEVLPNWVFPATVIGLLFLLSSWIFVFGFRQARHQAIQSLAKTDRYLRAIISNTPIILAAVDKNGLVSMVDGQALESINLKPETIIGKSIYELYPNKPEIAESVKLALSGQKISFKTEINDRMFTVNITPVIDRKSEIELVAVALDSTEEFHLDQAKSQFMRLVQHQLRTPPTAIRWSAELLDPILKKSLKGEDLDLWETVKKANERMISLANSISLVSEITSGTLALNPSTFRFMDVLDAVLAANKALIHEKKIDITTEIAEQGDLKLDKELFEIVLQSLISNAIEYTEEKTKVEVKFESDEENFMLSVKDQGWGIDQESQKKVFEQFFREEGAIRVNPEGLGMALYMTKNILNLIGGKIWFESAPGKGSIFFVEIPRGVSSAKKEA